VHVAARVGGTFLFQLLNATLLVANLGSAVAAQFGASRLMYSMVETIPYRRGSSAQSIDVIMYQKQRSHRRCDCLDWSLSSHLRSRVPELLNFGAFIAFIGVQRRRLWSTTSSVSEEKVTFPFLIPALGILVCTFIWLHLSGNAQILGVIWIGVGLLVAWFMRGSRKPTSSRISRLSTVLRTRHVHRQYRYLS